MYINLARTYNELVNKAAAKESYQEAKALDPK